MRSVRPLMTVLAMTCAACANRTPGGTVAEASVSPPTVLAKTDCNPIFPVVAGRDVVYLCKGRLTDAGLARDGVYKVSMAAGSVPTLMTGDSFLPMAADGANVYGFDAYRSNASLLAMPLGGGPSSSLATGLDLYVSWGGAVVVDSAGIYFSDKTRVLLLPVGGGPVTTILSGQDGIAGFTVDASNLYVGVRGTADGTGTILRVGKNGGAPVTLLSQLTALHGNPAVDNSLGNLFWIDGYGLHGMRLQGGGMDGGGGWTLATQDYVNDPIFVLNSTVYFSNLGEISAIPSFGGTRLVVAAAWPGNGSMAMAPGGIVWIYVSSVDPNLPATINLSPLTNLCSPQSCSPDANRCDDVSDGCGGTTHCSCSPGSVCTISSGHGLTCCKPSTTCPAGACGSVSDGCGGSISCGCSAGQVCLGSVCCQPLRCPAGFCGSMGDSCGGSLSCGCSAGQVCQQQSCCQPIKVCPDGECGTIDNGCGGTFSCAHQCAVAACRDACQQALTDCYSFGGNKSGCRAAYQRCVAGCK